ncbi:MAG: 5-bromo-4-chloroindolyl phosphate hydrolysis family protein [Eubacteriaceae bacterium]|nr:5-bromo-4-chloroindolyl phosphate hydrolysis family protein [Eubacteriaceae bacterium]
MNRRTYDFSNIAVDGIDLSTLNESVGAGGFPFMPFLFFFFFSPFLFGGIISFVAVLLMINGFSRRNQRIRIRENALRYYQLLRSRESFSVDEVAYFLNLPRNRVQAELQYLFDNNIIRVKPQTVVYPSPRANRTAYDRGRMYAQPAYTVEKVNENYKQPQKTYSAPPAKQQQPQQQESAPPAGVEMKRTANDNGLYAETVEYIKKIRQANEAIPGEVMSAKIDELEKVTINIYNATVENPSLLKKTKKFMSYYLPTTEKLIEKYAELDKKSIQTENTIAIKSRIEESLDTITKAFYELYNSLYDYDAIDITSEIEAFKNTLVNDGLLDNGMQIELKAEEKVGENVQ